MTDINKILKGFGSIAEFRDFLNEKINDGAEISRGKDENDTSKQEKENEQAEGGEEAPEGGEEGSEGPVIDPSSAPGSQVTIGNKDVKDNVDPEAVEVKISGEKQKLNMKPTAKIDNTNGINSR